MNDRMYAFRRKGQDSFCTCDERRYLELAEKPSLFEVAVFCAHPAIQPAAVPDDFRAAVAGLIADIERLIVESDGVCGLPYLRGTIPWHELTEGGRFERFSHLEKVSAMLSAAPVPPSQDAPKGWDAEFVAKRLGRVARLVGYEIPDRFTHEQTAEAAGTILGSIASILETKPSELDQECLRIGQEIQRAAGELPEGYNIEIDVEKGAGTVSLIDEEGDRMHIDIDEYLSSAIREAIDAAAMAKEKQS